MIIFNYCIDYLKSEKINNCKSLTDGPIAYFYSLFVYCLLTSDSPLKCVTWVSSAFVPSSPLLRKCYWKLEDRQHENFIKNNK